MQMRGVGFVLYKASDLDRPIELYRDTLGLPLEKTFTGAWAEASAGQATSALGQPEPDEASLGPGTGAQVALLLHGLKAAVEHLREKGVAILQESGETPVCHLALITDPDGNRVWLHQRKDGTAG